MNVARYQEKPARIDLCPIDDDASGAPHRCIHALTHLVADHAQRAGLPARFAATKLVENDPLVVEALRLDENETDAVEHIVRQMEEESGKDRLAALADMRFSYIEGICADAVAHPVESREHRRSAAIDRVLTGRYTALPAFLCIMALVFWLTFAVVGQPLSDLLGEEILDRLGTRTGDALASLEVNPVVQSLGGRRHFRRRRGGHGLPPHHRDALLLPLTARGARATWPGLPSSWTSSSVSWASPGAALLPMLIGFGCSVPAIMATRTIPSEHDRKMTIMLTPFMSCSAKLPIYAMVCAAFFPQNPALVMIRPVHRGYGGGRARGARL